MTITAKNYTLPRQASNTVNASYVANAIANIDGHLGVGYAKAHPDLICAYLHAASADYSAVVSCLKKLNERLLSIRDTLDNLVDRAY